MAGSESAGWVNTGLYLCPHFLAGFEADDAACRNGDVFARFGVAPRAFTFLAQFEIAEPGHLDLLAAAKSAADFFEEGVHEFLGFALAEAKLFKQCFRQICFCKCHFMPPYFGRRIAIPALRQCVPACHPRRYPSACLFYPEKSSVKQYS